MDGQTEGWMDGWLYLGVSYKEIDTVTNEGARPSRATDGWLEEGMD